MFITEPVMQRSEDSDYEESDDGGLDQDKI